MVQGRAHASDAPGVPVRGSGHFVLTLLILLATLEAPAAAQDPPDDRRLWTMVPQSLEEPSRPGIAFLASALAPGAGQYLLGADRWVPYAVLEVWAWITYLDRRGHARSLTRRYHDLAWSVARRVSVGERRDSVFDYYESMSRFASSGLFDADPREAGIQPEPDPTTYNGDVWLLARSLFFPGGFSYPPGTVQYERAMQYYQQHAIPASFAWAWGDSNLEQKVFNELIRESDEAFRSATQLLGAILANHVVSAIDALVLARFQRTPGPVTARLGSGIEWERGGRWTLKLRVFW